LLLFKKLLEVELLTKLLQAMERNQARTVVGRRVMLAMPAMKKRRKRLTKLCR